MYVYTHECMLQYSSYDLPVCTGFHSASVRRGWKFTTIAKTITVFANILAPLFLRRNSLSSIVQSIRRPSQQFIHSHAFIQAPSQAHDRRCRRHRRRRPIACRHTRGPFAANEDGVCTRDFLLHQSPIKMS